MVGKVLDNMSYVVALESATVTLLAKPVGAVDKAGSQSCGGGGAKEKIVGILI
jgi:hypothetical protein